MAKSLPNAMYFHGSHLILIGATTRYFVARYKEESTAMASGCNGCLDVSEHVADT